MNPIYATKGCPATTNNETYRFISTLEVVEALESTGWGIEQTKIAKTRRVRVGTDALTGDAILRESPKAGYQRHRVVFGRADAKLPEVAGARAQIMLTNDHSGGGAFTLAIGLYRAICANGLAIPAGMVAKVRFTHRSKLTPEEFRTKVFEEVMKLETAFTDKVLPMVARMSATTLTETQSTEFATRAAEAAGLKPENVADLLVPQREADQASDLFTIFNRVQEYAIRGGVSQVGRVRRTREVTNLKRLDAINETLFTVANEYAKAA